MKKLGLLLLICFASVLGLKAQVSVEVTMDRDQFLPNESIPVAVRVVNRSGQTIHLGKEVDWLTFSVESHDGFIVTKSGEVPVVKEFDLQSSERATRRCDLSPYYNLGQPGHYSVVATVKIKDWNMELTSDPKTFDVVPGTKIWEQEFGVPGKTATPATLPDVRKYILQQATFVKESGLYLRLTDAAETQCYKLVRVGSMSSVSHPEPKLDKASNMHLVYQTGSRIFTYSVFNPDGELLKRQTYEYANTRPRLGIDDEGKVSVVGGTRRIASSDFPEASPNSLPNDVPPPKP